MAAISRAREPLRAVGAESVGYTLVTLAPNMASGGTLLPLICQAVSLTEAFAAPVHAPDFKSGVRL